MTPIPDTPSGWLNIDKPAGITSTRVVSIVRKLLHTRKVGHAGTLDPFASGVLPIAVGDATKTVMYMQDGVKTYLFTVVFGEARDTDDIDGTITASSTVIPSREAIITALPSFLGEITQIPPIYSAIKVDGKRSYALARGGSNHVLAARKVTVFRLELLHKEGVEASFSMICGKGTYVRSIARDLSEKLGTYGYVSALRRTQVGKFSHHDAISLDNLEQIVHNRSPNECLLPVDTALDDIPVITVSPEIAERIGHGQKVPVTHLPADAIPVIRIETEGKLIALGTVQEGYIKPVRVFNNLN